jgi:hypothetical protein
MYRNLGAGPNENAFVEYKAGFTNIEPGRGYWLLIRNRGSILNTGAGSTPANLPDLNNPFSVELQPGYNLIGNPYNFKLSWEDIKNDSRNKGVADALEHFKIYENGTFLDGTVLEEFGGAYVFASRKVTVYFPTLKNLVINTGRKSFDSLKTYNDGHWQLKLTLQAGGRKFVAAGVGMHRQASPSKDAFDDITLPRFLKWAEINFNHPEYFYPDFSRDIVPPQENYSWDFTAQGNVGDNYYQLKWDKNALAFTNKRFILYDVANQVVVDMKLMDHYRFSPKGAHKFKIYYGTNSFIADARLAEKIYLGESFPNPFSQVTTIPFGINGNRQGYFTLNIYDATGRSIICLYEGAGEPGFRSIQWDGRNEAGMKMPAGIYLCRMAVGSGKETTEFTTRLVLMD